MNYRVTTSLLIALLLASSLVWAGDRGISVALQSDDPALAIALASAGKQGGAFLGIVPEEVTSDIASDYGVQTGQGVLIESVVDGSPADEAGLRSNDILLSLNGQKLTGPSELRVQLAKFKKGDEVSLVYMRGGNERTASTKLADQENEFSMNWSWSDEDEEMPPDAPHTPKPRAFHWDSDWHEQAAFAGVVTQELSDGLKKYFKVEGGALISEVVKDSPAEKAGLKAGDIVTKIGAEEVEDEGDVREAIREAGPDKTVDFHLIRDGQQMVIPVTLTNRKDFYGDATSPEGQFYLGFGDKDAKVMALEMEQLQQELEGLGVELERIPEVNMDLRISPDGPRVFISDGDARAISRDEGWWNWTFEDLRSKIKVGMEAVKKDIETLKVELQKLKTELRSKMSSLWSPMIEVVSQA